MFVNYRGQKKHINFSNINFLSPAQNPPFWAPRKKFMCLISWERAQKRDPHKLFWGVFGSRKGVPNGRFSATAKKKRDKLNGTNGVSAKICGFLRFSAKICASEFCNSQEKRTSAEISENLQKAANSARFVPFRLSLLIPLEKSLVYCFFLALRYTLETLLTQSRRTSRTGKQPPWQ